MPERSDVRHGEVEMAGRSLDQELGECGCDLRCQRKWVDRVRSCSWWSVRDVREIVRLSWIRTESSHVGGFVKQRPDPLVGRILGVRFSWLETTIVTVGVVYHPCLPFRKKRSTRAAMQRVY